MCNLCSQVQAGLNARLCGLLLDVLLSQLYHNLNSSDILQASLGSKSFATKVAGQIIYFSYDALIKSKHTLKTKLVVDQQEKLEVKTLTLISN